MIPKQRQTKKALRISAEEKIGIREDRFSGFVDFGELTYVSDALYIEKDWDKSKVTKSVVNEYAATRINLTNLSWGLVMELFTYHQVYELMKPHKEGCVLDVGCGEPVLFDFMADSWLHTNYVGIDLRASALRQFSNSKNCVVIADDIITTKAIRDGSMKVVVLSEVLEHLAKSDGVKLLRNIRRWMTTDGSLVITVPIKPVGLDIDMDHEFEKWGHVHYYEIQELEQLLVRCGYSISHKTFGKFRSDVQIKQVRAAFIEEYGDVGEEIIDIFLKKLPQQFVASMFVNWAGDQAGHVQIVANKKPSAKKKVARRRKKK